MILTGNEIIQNQKDEKITISPFLESMVNPNSYDIRLGNKLFIYKNEILDSRAKNEYEVLEIKEEGFVLEKDQFYLGHSVEIIGSEHFVPILHNKSGIARLGLFIHITADLIDIGSKGNITLQLFPTNSIKIYPNMKIGQISFWCVKGEIEKYKGRYTNSVGPVASKSYLTKHPFD
jgi:dCTP deaminase